MSYWRIIDPRTLPIAIFLSLTTLFSIPALQAKDPPSDACAMLPAAQVSKVLEQPFGSPTKAKAPAAFPGSPTGTDCAYQSRKTTERPCRVGGGATLSGSKIWADVGTQILSS